MWDRGIKKTFPGESVRRHSAYLDKNKRVDVAGKEEVEENCGDSFHNRDNFSHSYSSHTQLRAGGFASGSADVTVFVPNN